MTGLDKLVHPTRGILLSGKWEGTPDAGSNLGNPEGIMLREKINLRWPHTVWFHLHNLLTMRRGEGDQISGCRGRGTAGGGCRGVTEQGGTESSVVGGSCVFPLCSGCMKLHTWQQDPGAHSTLLPSASALVSGLHWVRCHQERKLGEGSLGPLLSLQLTLISLLSSK